MQNSKCKMQNEGVAFSDLFQSFFEEKYHNSAFCIMHYAFKRQRDKSECKELPYNAGVGRPSGPISGAGPVESGPVGGWVSGGTG